MSSDAGSQTAPQPSQQESAGRPRPPRRAAFRFVAAGISLALGVILAEGLCRWLAPALPPIRFTQDVEELNQWGLNRFANILKPDPELFWRLPSKEFLPESAGINFGVIGNATRLREDHDIPFAKPAGETRVLFLGDSCTFGAGVHVRDGYVEVAERDLQAEVPGVKWECINSGVPGYSLFQGYRYYELEGWKYEPDLVVACFGFNDMSSWDQLSDSEHFAATQQSQPPSILKYSRVCQLAWGVLHAARPSGEPRARVPTDEFRRLLVQLKDSARQRGADLMLVSWALQAQLAPQDRLGRTPHQQVLMEFSSAEGVPFIDLVVPFEELANNHSLKEIYLDNVHTTAFANQVVGKHVAERIREWYQTRSTKTSPP